MRVTQTTRLANPHKKRTRRNMSPKQIKHFGTARQKAALKASRKRKRNASAKVTRVKVARNKPRARRSPNPLVLHLKPIAQRSNPKRRAATMAKPKRKRSMKNARRRVARVSNRRRASKPRRRSRRRNTVARAPRRRTRRRNSVQKIVVMAPRRQNRRRNGGRRNPQLFGNSLGSKSSLMILGGGLAGVAAVKFIPTLIPTSLTASLGTSSFAPFLISGVSAVAAWWLASKVSVPFSEGVLFGGLMQTASVALNAFLPNFTIGGIPIALSGFGDLVAGNFVVPQNPLRPGGQRQMSAPAGMLAPSGSKVTTSGLGRAYPSAY